MKQKLCVLLAVAFWEDQMEAAKRVREKQENKK